MKEDLKPLKVPVTIHIAITGRCNLSCKYCFYSDEMLSRNDLPGKTWLAFFEELRDAGVMHVVLGGGEAFTRPDIWELIEAIVRNKMRFGILSNGTLIDDEVGLYLNAYQHRIDYIQISIDGSCPEVHDKIRGQKGALEKTLHGIEVLRKYRLPWTVRVTISKLNVHDLEATLNMLYYDLGMRHFGVTEAFPRGAGHCNQSILEMSPEERRLAFQVMQDFDKKHPGVVSGSQGGPLVVGNLIEKITLARKTGKFEVPYRTGYLTGCNIMWRDLSVLHDGTYVPCHQLSHMALGKVGQDSLLDIWQNSPLLVKLRERHKIPLSTVSHCRDCMYKQYCTGGCPGVAYAITGEINNINPRNCYRAYIGEDPFYAY